MISRSIQGGIGGTGLVVVQGYNTGIYENRSVILESPEKVDLDRKRAGQPLCEATRIKNLYGSGKVHSVIGRSGFTSPINHACQ